MARRTAHKTCNLCEATCGLLIDVEDNRVVDIRPDPEDPISRGHMCAKALALKEVQEDPDRLRRPVRRKLDTWEEISWEEAFQEVAENIVRIQRRDGRDAVGSYLGNPGAHNFGTVAYLTLLTRASTPQDPAEALS
jgi:anaerobic selenocysteine-containing dehydrogenase